MSDTSYKKAVILVGHGGIPTDYPSELTQQFMALHKKRSSQGLPPTELELDLEKNIRNWPRTPETDPYKAGLESLATQLKPLMDGWILKTAYNEFCAPSIDQTVKALVANGIREVLLITTMLTPGGSHSETEIPVEVINLQGQFPEVEINYAWPFDLAKVAELLAGHIRSFSKPVSQTMN